MVFSFASVANRLAGLHHSHDPFLGPGMGEQAGEGATLEPHDPFLVDHRAGIDIASAHHLGNRSPQQEIVGRDETAVAHVHQLRSQGGDAGAPGDRKQRAARCAPAGVTQ